MAYNGGNSEPIKISHTELEVYRNIFMDKLVTSHQLKIEPRPIGEGNSSQLQTIFYCNCF